MKVKIIAELAQGYEGKPKQTYELAKEALKTNCDIIKFQCLYADETLVPKHRHYKLFKQLEMDLSVWKKVHQLTKKNKKELMLNISGFESLKIAKELKLNSIKLHAAHFFFNDLIKEIKDEFNNLYFSIGGIKLNELLRFIKLHGFNKKKYNGRINFTYGFQSTPTPIDKNNILKLKSYINTLPDFNFGFEDHTSKYSNLKLITPLLALPLGVKHLEKHLTLKNKIIEDNESALNSEEFSEFVSNIRIFEKALGDGKLVLNEEELKYRKRMLKVVVANRDIKKLQKINKNDISLKRINLSNINCIHQTELVLGKKIRKEKKKHDVILKQDLI